MPAWEEEGFCAATSLSAAGSADHPKNLRTLLYHLGPAGSLFRRFDLILRITRRIRPSRGL